MVIKDKLQFVVEREKKLTLFLFYRSHYTLACKHHTNADKSVFFVGII